MSTQAKWIVLLSCLVLITFAVTTCYVSVNKNIEERWTPEVVAMEQRLQHLQVGAMVILKGGDAWVVWRPTEQKRMFLRSIQGQQFNNEERSMYTWAWAPNVADIVHRDDSRWEQEAIRLVERMTRPNYDFEPSSSQPAEATAP